MARPRYKLIFPVLLAASLAFVAPSATARPSKAVGPRNLAPRNTPPELILKNSYGRLPLHFEPNVGQFDSQVRYVARGGGYTLFLTDTDAVMVLRRSGRSERSELLHRHEALPEPERAVVRMKLAGAKPAPGWEALEKQPGITNYFLGSDPAKWRTDVPNYGRIKAQGVYPGVDLVCYGNQRQLEYDLEVAPGADPGQIQLAWEGADKLSLNSDGDLVVATSLGNLVQKRPRVYQDIGGERVDIGSRYVLTEGHRVGFELARYDRRHRLVIDPLVLVYSTYLGGTGGDDGTAVAVDGAGSAYITGMAGSTDFPTRSPYQGANGGAQDVFVTKLSPTGRSLVYSTYLGGNGYDVGNAIAVDGAGSAYVTGITMSGDFPVQSGYQAYLKGSSDAFVMKLAPAGNALIYSTYVGGTGSDAGDGIAVDATGSAYVAGQTASSDFPTQSPYQATLQEYGSAFVFKLAPAGNTLVYSTYLGGNSLARAIAVDRSGSAYVTGLTGSANFPTRSPYQGRLKGSSDAFVTKFVPAGNELVYSTFLGGGGNEIGNGIAVDETGAVYVTGNTSSTDFPLTSPVQSTYGGGDKDAFVTKLAPAGNALVYSTYLGGSGFDQGFAITVDTAGSAYVAGTAGSPDFPVHAAYQSALAGTCDGFVAELTPAGAMAYSTYLGGTGASGDGAYGIAIDAEGSAYITGNTYSADFPTRSPYQGTLRGFSSAFVTKLAARPDPFALSSPSKGATEFPINSTLSWEASQFANSYDLYFGTSSTPPTVTTTSGTSFLVGPLSPATTYYWRVVAKNNGGSASSETWFFTTGVPPAQPVLLLPGNGSTGVTTPALSWSAASGAVSYDVYFGASSPPPLVATTTATTYAPGPVGSGTTYYWQVVAKNAIGTMSSSVWSFTAAVAAPVLVSPANGASDVSLSPVLMWNASAGAGSYDVYFGTQAWPPMVTNTHSTSYAPGALSNGGLYFWRVVAHVANKVAVSQVSSELWSFTTPLTQQPAAALRFVPVTPCRIADTRGDAGPFGGPTLGRGEQRAFAISQSGCGIPATAQAYSLNVTVVPEGPLSYITLWPAGQTQPSVSTLNSFDGIVVANAAIVPAGAGGAVSVFVTDPTDVILDINGYFDTSTGPTSYLFYPATPCRVADTRGATGQFGGPPMDGALARDFPIPLSSCSAPAAAQAYALNFTVVPTGSLGYLSAWPTGVARPNVSTLNSWTGKVVANAAIVPAGTNESISVFASNPTDLILDVNGYFAPPGNSGALAFYPVTPCRVADTRDSAGPFGGPKMEHDTSRTFAIPVSRCGIPSTAAAYSLNVTVVPDGILSYLTAWPTGSARPNVSTLNSWDGAVVANAAIVPAGTDGAVSIYVTHPTDVILDINGYFAP